MIVHILIDGWTFTSYAVPLIWQGLCVITRVSTACPQPHKQRCPEQHDCYSALALQVEWYTHARYSLQHIAQIWQGASAFGGTMLSVAVSRKATCTS